MVEHLKVLRERDGKRPIDTSLNTIDDATVFGPAIIIEYVLLSLFSSLSQLS